MRLGMNLSVGLGQALPTSDCHSAAQLSADKGKAKDFYDNINVFCLGARHQRAVKEPVNTQDALQAPR